MSGTHSWVEPTAINVLALRSADQAGHPRCREAVKLLLDRQLPEGGWNYGNTTVLGHVLRPQVQPTGLALAALAGETDIRPKVHRSLDLLGQTLSRAHDDRLALLCADGTCRARRLAGGGRRVASVGVPANAGSRRLALPLGAAGPGGETFCRTDFNPSKNRWILNQPQNGEKSVLQRTESHAARK